MAFATLLAGIAFFVAMIALWLSSDIARKVDSANERFVRSHIAGLRDEIRELDLTVTKVHRAIKQQESAQSGLDQRLDDHTKSLQIMKDQVVSLSTHLDNLDRSIPSRYRVRLSKAEAKPADKAAVKPSIQ